MSKRVLALGAAGVAIAVVAAVVLIGGGGGPAGEIVHGRPGFSLRGSLAHDDKAIETAVAEWRKQSAEDAKDPDADHTLEGPDADDTVTVLWAGHVREDDVVVAEAADEVAELSHQGSLGWSVDGVTARDRLEAPDAPVGAGGAMVLPDSGQWRYVDAAVLSGGVSRADGLLFGYDSSPEGFVVPTTDDVDPAVYIAGVGGRRVSRPDLAALRRALAAGGARALWRAADQGQSALDDAERRDRQSIGDAQTLSVVWTGRLPGHRHGAVVSEGRGPAMSLALGFGEVPKTANGGGKTDEGSQLLGFGSSRLGRRADADAGEAVGGAYVQLGDVPYLAVAGTGVKEITAIVGRHTISHSAPFALIPATPLEPKGGTATDTVVYGQDRYGAVIAPLPSSY